MEDEITEAPDMIGIVDDGFWHFCPLCGGGLFWSSMYQQFVCVRCGWLFDMDDIMTTELEIEEVE